MSLAGKIPQPMRPSGLAGRIFGLLMEWLASPNYHWAIRQLTAVKPKSYLEIGFGTGRLAQLVTRRYAVTRLCGVDPSELMLKTASRRLRRFARRATLDLRLGDDTLLASWPEGSFDAIVASHSWQFWSDPEPTLRRVNDLLSPSGRFVMVVRRHISSGVIGWIPNAVTKSGDELGGLRAMLTACGFHIVVDERLSTGSHGLAMARAAAL
jgi:SAM-dependent methyltransferase